MADTKTPVNDIEVQLSPDGRVELSIHDGAIILRLERRDAEKLATALTAISKRAIR